MAKTKVTKSKGQSPASYRANTTYSIGVKGPDKTLGFYSQHTMGDKGSLKVVNKAESNRMTRGQAHDVMNEIKGKWPQNSYTMFKGL